MTGELYYELINSTTGEVAMSSANNKMKVDAARGSSGMGFGIPMGAIGDFELNIYFNNELVHTVAIIINQ